MKNIFSKQEFLKMNGLAISSIIVFSIITLSSCVTQDQVLYLNDQVVALNKRVSALQETVNSKVSGDLDTRLKPIQTRQAETGAEMDDIRKQVEMLSGRVEESEHLVKRAVERDLGEQDTVQATLVALTQKVTELEAMVKHQQEYLGLEPLTEQKKQEKAAAGGVAEKPKSEEIELYDTSLAAYRKGKYEEAMEGFQNFTKKYPKSDRVDNAQFWVGECYMAQEKYEQAILAYQEVIKKYPGGNKVPNAMLRQATAFQKIGDKISTRLLLKKVIEKYPKSNEAQLARKKLETLK